MQKRFKAREPIKALLCVKRQQLNKVKKVITSFKSCLFT